MQWLKRTFLFIAINALVILALSFILSLFHIKPYLTAYGLDIRSLLIFCFAWGMVGALISLALSRKMAKWLLNIHLINPKSAQGVEAQLLAIVKRLARSANLSTTPEVGIFSSPSMNAFATGPTKRRSLVAVSTALIEQLDEGQLEAVLGHEISHISNGDMVTMTLIQGVVNAFVMFLARVLAFALSTIGSRSQRHSNRFSLTSFYLFSFLFEILFMTLGSIVVAFFSRIREYRADRGGAMLTSREKMIGALETLLAAEKKRTRNHKELPSNKALRALMITHQKRGLFLRLFSTHPPLQERINHLKL